ncbi:rhodanese-like domain-containing protein [Actinoplanes sp. URMC 104]|uniref:rhodanese-like domain-containing protein n=1 Tax=Actinoplanes sp. URMC 104 TaxID=3423409 RepID=UPI003F1C12A3
MDPDRRPDPVPARLEGRGLPPWEVPGPPFLLDGGTGFEGRLWAELVHAIVDQLLDEIFGVDPLGECYPETPAEARRLVDWLSRHCDTPPILEGGPDDGRVLWLDPSIGRRSRISRDDRRQRDPRSNTADLRRNEMTLVTPNRTVEIPAAAPEVAARHFEARLAFEADPADVASALASGTPGFTLIDCRPEGNYTKAHIPGAINVPWPTIDDAVAASLPEGLLITYCWGPACNGATKGAMLLAASGRSVKEMIGGLEYWIREGNPTEGRRPLTDPRQATPADFGLVV